MRRGPRSRAGHHGDFAGDSQATRRHFESETRTSLTTLRARCYSARMGKQTSTRFNWRRFYWQLAIYLVLYVLSIGPMYWRWHVAHHLSNPSLADTLIVQFYQPLLFSRR